MAKTYTKTRVEATEAMLLTSKADGILAKHNIRDLLTEVNPARIEEHRTLIPTLPDGVGDFEHLVGPTVYGLLAYGRNGLAALYQMSIEDPLSAAFVAGPVLVAAAVKDAKKAAEHVHLAQRYLSRGAYTQLHHQVVEACKTLRFRLRQSALFQNLSLITRQTLRCDMTWLPFSPV